MSWEWLTGLLPFLLLLACPLAMWFMMRGMSGDHCRRDSEHGSDTKDGELQSELETLRARVAELEGGELARRSGS